MAVPVGPSHCLGDLGQAAEGLAIPGEAFLQDHDSLELPFPFAHEQRAGLQTQALGRLGRAAVERSANAILFPRAKDPSDPFVEIAQSVGLQSIGQHGTVKLTRCEAESGYLAVMPIARDPVYRRHRFPPEVISHAVWLYFRFPLSLRMVEEMLVERGICVTYETVRQWGKKFGRSFADQIRRRAPARGDKWHLDEVVVTIAGEQHWLWRAVDQNGFVLDVLVQRRRDATAARRLMRRLLQFAATPPRVMITDKLRSYGAARVKMGLQIEHRQHKGLNNRAENSHQPTRRRERIMKRFKSARQAQGS
jgi:putative transposase